MKFKRTSGSVRVRDLDQEVILFDPRGERIHQLSSTAREIYFLCDSRTADEIADCLVERFDVPLETARKDVDETLDRLQAIGAIEAC